MKKSMQTWSWELKAEILDFGGVWDGFWEGLGRVLGGIWRLLGALGPFFGIIFHACIWNGLQTCSWKPLGSILA